MRGRRVYLFALDVLRLYLFGCLLVMLTKL